MGTWSGRVALRPAKCGIATQCFVQELQSNGIEAVSVGPIPGGSTMLNESTYLPPLSRYSTDKQLSESVTMQSSQ